MARFHLVDPGTGQRVEVILYDALTVGHRWDQTQEVHLRFGDGKHYRTWFWRDPQERGRHWWEGPGMVIVHDLTTELVLAAVDDFLRQEAIEDAFEPVRDSNLDAQAGGST